MSEGGPTYLSYLLRLWRVSNEDKPVWRASLQSTETGERVGFAGLEEVFEYLNRQMAWRQIRGTKEEDEPCGST